MLDTVATRQGDAVDQTAAVHQLLEDAAAHYRRALRSAPHAVRYLAGRGITGAAAARFGLGYARPKWQDLQEVLQDHDQAAVDASGLLAGTDDGRRRYDRFRDRLMFPIRDRAGRVAGFGGRVLSESDSPKYLNSPEGPTFRKRELLYGLYEGQDAIRAQGLAVVVEGYIDVISLSQAGFTAAVATLGTACSSAQLAELLAIAPRVVFCFDGDAAGLRAAAAALEAALPVLRPGLQINFAFLPAEHDPDSLVRAEGVAAFEDAIARAVPALAFAKQDAGSGCEMHYAEGRARYAHRLGERWALVTDQALATSLAADAASVLNCPVQDVVTMWAAAHAAAMRRSVD